jgi:hypothetical protein
MPLPLTKSKRKRQLCQDTKRDYKYRSGRTTAGEGPVEEINTTGTATVVLSSSPTLTGEPCSQLPRDKYRTAGHHRLCIIKFRPLLPVNESAEITTRTTTDEAVRNGHHI